jgi:penicillin-binding protein 2
MIPASKPRLFAVGLVVAALLAVLAGRLYDVQVSRHSKYDALANADQIRSIVHPAVRGSIVDDTGQPLVNEGSSLTIAVNVAQVNQQPDPNAVLDRLAQLLHISPTTMRDRVRICTVGVPQPCWPGSPYQPIPVAERVSEQTALQVLEHKQQFPGISANIQPTISYPQPVGSDAAQLLGYLQPITAQEVKTLHVPVTGFSAVDLVGQSGLEGQYDQQLRGTPGVDEVAVNASGQVTGTIRNDRPVAGDTLVTSLNAKLQTDTENILRNAILKAQASGQPAVKSGAAVVMTTTGRVVAMASYPTYNPGVWAGGISRQEFHRLFGTRTLEPILERATQGQYHPGSTWKVTTLTAGLNDGMSLYGSYNCPGSINVGGHVFNNDFGNAGAMSLHQALVVSCDTVFYEIGYNIWLHDNRQYNTVTSPKFPIQREQRTEMQWGFGKPTGIDLPGESIGSIPTRAWLYYFWKDNAHKGQNWCKFGRQFGNYVQQIEWDDCHYGNVWEPGQAIIASIGQGYIAVTPLQLADAYAALANGGTLYSPRIGAALIGPTGKLVRRITPPVQGHLPASKNALAYIRSALQGVITQGTAAGAFGGFPLGKVCVAGKTGTAQVAGNQSTSVFASFAPCSHPKYVAVVMIPGAGFGAETSAPAVRQIWDALFGLEGHAADLPGGNLPPLPHVSSTGQLVDSGASRPPSTTAHG